MIERLAVSCYAPFNNLKEKAANGHLIHNDDTKLRILEVIEAIKAGTIGDRKGMFTTGIIANYQNHQIALFMNGTQHAGENLAEILKSRVPGKSDIIQMCDGSTQNTPKTFSTILCNCLSHGFRKFEELVDFFPEECLRIMKLLGQVYDNDNETHSMTEKERLSYHQKHSQSVMDELKEYMDSLLKEHRIEPNSELGRAMIYMQNRWPELTRFLVVAGAPIDNNIVERALKIAIRNRKAAMFYKTKYSAHIGGMITSLIYTCVLADVNPYHYLTVLQHHQAQVNKTPSQWLPWNYEETLQSYKPIRPMKKEPANPQGPSPPEAVLVAI